MAYSRVSYKGASVWFQIQRGQPHKINGRGGPINGSGGGESGNKL